MKHFIATLIFFGWTLAGRLQAQITVTSSSFPEIGDTLYLNVDNLPANISVTGPGPNQRWDFSTLQSPFSRKTVARHPGNGQGGEGFSDAGFMIMLAENVEAYFRVTRNALLLLGYYGEDPLGLGAETLTRFDPYIVERHAPLRYRDEHRSGYDLSLSFAADELPRQILDQLPITPDSLRIRIHSEREDLVDAWGQVIIPGGIYDVLREKRIEMRQTRLDAKIGFLPWQDITALVPNIDQLGDVTTVTYYYFSNEAKEPIAVLYLDGEESTVLRVEYKANDVTTDVQNIHDLKPGVYAFPNPAIVNIRFEFSNLPAGNYTLTIFNILGVEMWQEDYFIDGNRTEKVNISNLRKGTYLYSLSDSRGRTLTTKRLMIIRP